MRAQDARGNPVQPVSVFSLSSFTLKHFYKITPMHSHFFQQRGFSLIEVLLSVLILSVFLLVTEQLERQVFQHLSRTLKANLRQLELAQTEEKLLAYPSWDLNSDPDSAVDRVNNNYREIFLCGENGGKTGLPISVQNLRLDSH